MFKPIKLNAENVNAISAALAAVNGRAHQHTFCAADVINLANQGEVKVISLVGSKKGAVGARICALSGKQVSSSYNNTRQATRIMIERKSAGWFLIDCESESIHRDGGYLSLFLTEKQHELAVNVLKKQYRISAAK